MNKTLFSMTFFVSLMTFIGCSSSTRVTIGSEGNSYCQTETDLDAKLKMAKSSEKPRPGVYEIAEVHFTWTYKEEKALIAGSITPNSAVLTLSCPQETGINSGTFRNSIGDKTENFQVFLPEQFHVNKGGVSYYPKEFDYNIRKFKLHANRFGFDSKNDESGQTTANEYNPASNIIASQPHINVHPTKDGGIILEYDYEDKYKSRHIVFFKRVADLPPDDTGALNP